MLTSIPKGSFGDVLVAMTGLMGPEQWVILNASGTVATASSPNGWTVTADNATAPTRVTISVPASAASVTYEVRWRGLQTPSGYQRYNNSFIVP